MRTLHVSLALAALVIAFGCSDDASDSSSTTTGGQTSTGGAAMSGAAGSTATGGASGTGSGGTAGTGAQSGDGGSGARGGAGTSGSSGSSGEGGGGNSGGESDGGAGGAGECAPSSSDNECARCMLENCCAEWRACEADQNCNACGSCLDELSDFGACILMQPPLCNFVGADATGSMIQCGCQPDANAQCVGPCASACGFD